MEYKEGKANMVDVAGKPDQERTAIASEFIGLQPETIKLVKENSLKKGDVLTIAEVAGIQQSLGYFFISIVPAALPYVFHIAVLENPLN